MMISHSVSPHKSIGTRQHPEPPAGHFAKMMALVGLALVLAALAAGAMLLRPQTTAINTEQTPEAFVAQMERAAQGVPYDHTVFGGPMKVERKGGQIVVTAMEIPPPVCVTVGWKLVRKGLLSINGTTPLRVSAAKLSELCYQDDSAATLTWSPRQTE